MSGMACLFTQATKKCRFLTRPKTFGHFKTTKYNIHVLNQHNGVLLCDFVDGQTVCTYYLDLYSNYVLRVCPLQYPRNKEIWYQVVKNREFYKNYFLYILYFDYFLVVKYKAFPITLLLLLPQSSIGRPDRQTNWKELEFGSFPERRKKPFAKRRFTDHFGHVSWCIGCFSCSKQNRERDWLLVILLPTVSIWSNRGDDSQISNRVLVNFMIKNM
jgi:hypothetical protein